MNSNKSESGWKVEIEKIQANKETKSDSARLQDVLNELSTTGVKIGQITFDNTEIPLLYETVTKIYEHLAKAEGSYVQSSVIADANTNTIMNYDGMPADSTGMEKYREMQNRYAEIISNYDPKVLERSVMIGEYLASPFSAQSFPAMIADGEFTDREASITEKNLENLVRELDGIKISLQTIADREARDRDNGVDVNIYQESY